jgi:hypothetical protein
MLHKPGIRHKDDGGVHWVEGHVVAAAAVWQAVEWHSAVLSPEAERESCRGGIKQTCKKGGKDTREKVSARHKEWVGGGGCEEFEEWGIMAEQIEHACRASVVSVCRDFGLRVGEHRWGQWGCLLSMHNFAATFWEDKFNIEVPDPCMANLRS